MECNQLLAAVKLNTINEVYQDGKMKQELRCSCFYDDSKTKNNVPVYVNGKVGNI